ncbi:MAG: hypothetical protein JXR64_05930 [Spirochaetales bacterium]|nr:hypothetical protein [Spirochaetales bacterium]
MKKTLLTISLILLTLSCNKKVQEDPGIELIKTRYIIQNSDKPGTFIKKEINTKKIILLSYPDYITESYSLIKYVTGLLVLTNTTTVSLPFVNDLNSIYSKDLFFEKNPLLNFNEFNDLLDYYSTLKISLVKNFEFSSDILLILAPESKYKDINKELLPMDKNQNILNITMAGVGDTLKLNRIIKQLPSAKKVSSINIKDFTLNEVPNGINIVILMGEMNNYKKVSARGSIYSVTNYNNAPSDFKTETKSFIESIQIKKMNNYLPKLINEEYKKYGELK